MDLVRSTPDDRRRRRAGHEEGLKREPGSRRLKNSEKNRSIVVDLARLDAVDWLAGSSGDGAPGRTRQDSERASGGGRGAESHVQPAEQVSVLAKAMATETWPRISGRLDQVTPHPRDVRRELAHHGWCDLLVGMIRVIESVNGPLRALSRMPASLIKDAILTSSAQDARPHVTAAVVGLVVDEVWRAFIAVACGGGSPFGLLGGEEALRALRILAVFICPAPRRHPEVRRYALKPLGEDVHHILTAQTEARLAELFAEWLP
ncbi:hypothetical protein C6W10_05440 [Plantactinospora sp. BB1]|nr:hypothetical protein C6W10_05440 [Plantactinospora sp. BB1]